MKTILITGGLGYLGYPIMNKLITKGYKVVLVDNTKNVLPDMLKNSYKDSITFQNFLDNKHNILLVNEDISNWNNSDYHLWLKLDGIIHLASKHLIPESIKDPISFYDNNITSTLNVIKLSEKNNNCPILFASSGSVYQDNKNYQEFSVSSPTNPLNAYSETKLICEKILKSYSKTKNVPVCVFRIFNIAGYNRCNSVGNSTHLIPKAFYAKYNSNLFGMYGNSTRDFIHVLDVANAFVLGLKYLSLSNDYHLFNLSSGLGTTTQKILSKIDNLFPNSKPFEIFKFPERENEQTYSVGNNLLIKQKLGYELIYNLDDILLSTKEYFETIGFF